MLGGKNFSLFGRPFLDRAKVHVDAVVVEKAPKYPELLHYCNQHYLVRIERCAFFFLSIFLFFF